MTMSLRQCVDCNMRVPVRREGKEFCQHERIFEVDPNYGYYVFDKGEIPLGRSQRKKVAVWCQQGDKIYATCLFCGGVNDLSNHEINTEGVVEKCATCRSCGGHSFIVLRNWDGGCREAVYVNGDEDENEDDDDSDDYPTNDDDDDNN